MMVVVIRGNNDDQFTISRYAKNSNWVKLKVGQTSPMTIRAAWGMV